MSVKMKKYFSRKNRKGFTLFEVIVSVMLLAMVSAIIMPIIIRGNLQVINSRRANEEVDDAVESIALARSNNYSNSDITVTGSTVDIVITYDDETLGSLYDVSTETNIVNATGDRVDVWAISNDYSTLTFKTNGGSSISPYITAPGASISAPAAPSKSGYTFAGWYADSSLTTAFTFSTMPSRNTSIYAKWVANTYTIIFNADGGTAEYTSKSVTYGQLVGSMPTATKSGYTFAGWYTQKSGGGVLYNASSTYNIAGSVTLYAQWIGA